MSGIEVQGPVQGLEFRIALVVVGVVEHAVLLINKWILILKSINKYHIATFITLLFHVSGCIGMSGVRTSGNSTLAI